jgi:hypothetical protein
MAFTAADRDRLVLSPRAFLDRAALMVAASCSTPTLYGKPDVLTLEQDEGTTAYRQFLIGDDVGMDRVPFYILRKAKGTDTVTFSAYLVEYEDGKTPITVLGTAATMCFTANMNGCTFGIGSQANANSGLVVTHSNSRGHGSQDANTADQRFRAGNVVGPDGRLFEPEHYRTNNKQSITFGYRSPGQLWRFCFLSYQRHTGQRITTYGVQDVVTNQVQG